MHYVLFLRIRARPATLQQPYNQENEQVLTFYSIDFYWKKNAHGSVNRAKPKKHEPSPPARVLANERAERVTIPRK